jgi:hypothetical protein
MSDETDAWARVIARKLAAMERELGVNDALVRLVVDNAQALARDVPSCSRLYRPSSSG